MIKMAFEGGKEIADALAGMSERLSKKILMDALKKAAEPMRAAAAAHAPRRPPAPDLASNIGISAARSEDQAAVKIGPVKGFAYGLPLEVGTLHMSAQPFMRPAFDANLDATLRVASDELWQALTKRGVSRPATFAAPDRDDE